MVAVVCVPEAEAVAGREEASPSVSTSEAAAILRLRWTAGALRSRGFLALRILGWSAPSAAVVLGFSTEPGLRPGFLRGTPAAVSCTHLPSMNSKRFCAGWRPPVAEPGPVPVPVTAPVALPVALPEPGDGCWYCWKVICRCCCGGAPDDGWRWSLPTTISPRSMVWLLLPLLWRPALVREGDPGSDSEPEGGDERSSAEDSYRDVSPAAAMFGWDDDDSVQAAPRHVVDVEKGSAGCSAVPKCWTDRQVEMATSQKTRCWVNGSPRPALIDCSEIKQN